MRSLFASILAAALLVPEQRVHVNSNTDRGGADVTQVPGKKIGTVTTRGNIIHLELDEGVVRNNLFDLDKRTLRFTPADGGFRAENLPLQWEQATGTALQSPEVRLTKFRFPFSGKTWDAMTMSATGLITFGGAYSDLGLGRFVHLQQTGPAIANRIPLIAAFLKQRMNGTRFANELDDRLILTWDTSEPTAGQQDVTFARTPHHYQAVLHRDGRVDLSYREITARDAVVGVYSVPAGAAAATSTDLSAVKPTDPARPAIFEAFHHYSLPGSSNMACTVIQALGDRFDFMVWYSDFRVDDQEAGTRSVGDIGQKVSGLGPRMDGGLRLADYCSQGRLQVTWYQPVWIGSVQAQAQHPDGRYAGYNMAVAQISHELAHRWSTRTRAIVGGETIELRGPHDPWGMSGATHWPASVTTPVPFPYSRPVEASIMGGAHWKDNGDGTFINLANGTMNPASGFSYLELYLMGFLPASKVPDFFVLRNQRPAGRTPEGQTIVAAEKVRITIQDVIAHNGPRVPSFDDSPKALNTAIVAVTLKGRQPTPAMLTQLEGIRSSWIDYWSKVTGGVSTMSTTTGQNPPTQAANRPIVLGEARSFHSAILNEDRELQIALPESYGRTAISYPVLFVLDGSSHLLHASATTRFLASARNRIPEMIVVALPNTNRNRDMTPGPGAATFQRVLADEIIPWVERNYRAAPDRILSGHSLSGSFAVHTLLNRPELFRTYVAASAPLWRYEGLAADMRTGFPRAATAGAAIYLTVGQHENEQLRNGMQAFAAALKDAAAGTAPAWSFVDMKGEDHSSTPQRSLYDALEARYVEWRFPFFEDEAGLARVGGLPGIESHYRRMSKHFGYAAPPPEGTLLQAANLHVAAGRHDDVLEMARTYAAPYPSLSERLTNQVGYDQLKRGQIDRAVRTFTQNAEAFPDSPNVHDSLGDAFCRAGDTASARQSYERAARVAEKRSPPHPRAAWYRDKALKGCP